MQPVLDKTIIYLGYTDIQSFAQEHAVLTLMAKIESLKIQILRYESKYRLPYSEFREKFLKNSDLETFDYEDDGMDWQYLSELLQMYESDLRNLKNA